MCQHCRAMMLQEMLYAIYRHMYKCNKVLINWHTMPSSDRDCKRFTQLLYSHILYVTPRGVN